MIVFGIQCNLSPRASPYRRNTFSACRKGPRLCDWYFSRRLLEKSRGDTALRKNLESANTKPFCYREFDWLKVGQQNWLIILQIFLTRSFYEKEHFRIFQKITSIISPICRKIQFTRIIIISRGFPRVIFRWDAPQTNRISSTVLYTCCCRRGTSGKVSNMKSHSYEDFHPLHVPTSTTGIVQQRRLTRIRFPYTHLLTSEIVSK